jgi:hypothetical protein
MEKNNKRKVYQKPSWQKQEMFERFAVSCGKKGAGSTGGCHSPSKS